MVSNQRIGQALSVFVFLIIAVLITGCGNEQNGKTTQQSYGEDGYMGLTNANPGILTSPNSRTYGNEAELVDMALKDIPHIRRKTVQFEGRTLIVRIKLDRDLSKQQAAEIKDRAADQLVYMFPRYEVRVRASQ